LFGAALFFGILKSFGSEVYQGAVGIAMLVGLLVVCHSSDFFKPNLQQGYTAILPRFLDMDTYCSPNTPGIKRIQDYGLEACALQNNHDMSGAITELQKGIHFGPGLTLADNAATLAADEKPVNHCARAFKAAERLCPLAFSSVGKEERAALLEASE
jgi:hypothetical protein